MKSNTCQIKSGTKGLAAILNESEKVATYNGLSHKQNLQLRLLCEEIYGMLPNIIEKFEGSLWLEFEDGVCKINVSIKSSEFNYDKKEKLIGIARDKKNAAAVGIVGKIRNAIENFFLNQDSAMAFTAASESFYFPTEYNMSVDYTYLWSLEQYRNSVKKEEQAEAWDELEKSVIASVADDVIVGVKGSLADITIVKKFAKGEKK
jgi:hypothetical protein